MSNHARYLYTQGLWPPGSYEHLGWQKAFPQNIIFRFDKTDKKCHVTRRYQSCGCFHESGGTTPARDGLCCIHEGPQSTIWSPAKQLRELVKQATAVDRDLAPLLDRKRWLDMHIAGLRKQRDQSPTRQ